MDSFTTSRPASKEFAAGNAYVSTCSDEKLLADYSDFMHTSRGASASSDERHAILAEIRRRGLATRYIETPQAIEDRRYQRAMEARFSPKLSVLPLPPDLGDSWVTANRENVRTLLARIFTGKKQ